MDIGALDCLPTFTILQTTHSSAAIQTSSPLKNCNSRVYFGCRSYDFLLQDWNWIQVEIYVFSFFFFLGLEGKESV